MSERPERLIDTVARQASQLREQDQALAAARAEIAANDREHNLFVNIETVVRALQKETVEAAECAACREAEQPCVPHNDGLSDLWRSLSHAMFLLDRHRERQRDPVLSVIREVPEE